MLLLFSWMSFFSAQQVQLLKIPEFAGEQQAGVRGRGQCGCCVGSCYQLLLPTVAAAAEDVAAAAAVDVAAAAEDVAAEDVAPRLPYACVAAAQVRWFSH